MTPFDLSSESNFSWLKFCPSADDAAVRVMSLDRRILLSTFGMHTRISRMGHRMTALSTRTEHAKIPRAVTTAIKHTKHITPRTWTKKLYFLSKIYNRFPYFCMPVNHGPRFAELEKRTQAFEMRCYRRLLNISYKDHVNNGIETIHRQDNSSTRFLKTIHRHNWRQLIDTFWRQFIYTFVWI